MNTLLRTFALTTFVFISGCSQNDEDAERKATYESYEFSDLQLMVDEGRYDEALEVLNYYRDASIASDDHLTLLTQIYIEQGDGVAADTMIDRLQGRGVSDEAVALQQAQALVLQNKADEAYDLLLATQLPDEDKFSAFLLLGDIALSENDLDQSEQFYTSAVNDSPENFKGHLALANLFLRQGNVEKAKQSIDRADQYNSQDTLVSYTQGLVARSMNDTQASIDYFKKAIEINEFNILARSELVSAYLDQRNIEAAQAEIDEIYSRSPNNSLANYYQALILADEGRFDEAEEMLLRTGSLPQSYPPSARAYGLVSYQLDKYITAIPHLRRALQFFPYDNRIRLALSDSYLRRGQAGQTLALLEPLIEQQPNIPALIQAARASIAIGDTKKARVYFEQAMQLTEGDVESDDEALVALKESLAYARYFDNDLDGAMQVLDAIYSETLDVDALVNQANLMLLSGDADGAESILRRIEEAEPGSPVGANLKGTIRHSQERFEEAVDAYDFAIQQNPEYQSALKNRALSYIMLRDFTSARRDLDKVITLSPNDPQIMAMYGRALLETGDAELALPYLEQSVKNRPNSPVVVADYAEALAELGYYSSALTNARKARTLAPDNARFVAYLEEKSSEWETAQVESEAQAREEL